MHDDDLTPTGLPGQPLLPAGEPQPFSRALLSIGRMLMALSAGGFCVALACQLLLPKAGSQPQVNFAAWVVSGWLLLLGSVLTVSSGVTGRVRTFARLVLAATGAYLMGRLILC
ncbi:TPA: hypothetical protein QDB04_000105 [Burkholderia vietnamiensis]|nr:hypothetical protein [Burkholderia vietnamiensis]